MNILFDRCVPRTLRRRLNPLTIKTTREMGWEELSNGRLLREAEKVFEVMITTDTNIEYQQRLPSYDIGLIVLHSLSNKTAVLVELVPAIAEYIARKGMP
jgi:predicted nuclease of predicted toxin-antitoxin system